MDKEKYDKFLIESMEKLIQNFDKNASDEEFEKAVSEFETICHSVFYEKVISGYFYEFENMKDSFEFFVRIKDSEKSKVLGKILLDHYETKMKKYLSNCMEEEKYEVLAVITEVKKII